MPNGQGNRGNQGNISNRGNQGGSNRGGSNRGNSGNQQGGRNYQGDNRMFRGNQGGQGSNQGNEGGGFSLYHLKEQMYYGIQTLQTQLNTLQEAYDALEVTEGITGEGSGFTSDSGGFTGDQEVGPRGGNRNFASSNDASDDRTLAGRQNDDEEFSTDDLNQFLRTAARSQTDNSIDMRTKEGRALFAAGWIDDAGFPIVSGNSGGSNRGGAHQMAGR